MVNFYIYWLFNIYFQVALNDIRRKGRYVLTYSLNDNYKSQKLFTKLKFEPLGQVAWIYLSKENNQN